MVARGTGELPHESFQGMLLQLRGRTGLTQRQLATSLGMHWRSIQGWESGANYPSAASLRLLLVAYLEAGALTPGKETAHADAVWTAAIRQAPRLRTPLDHPWFAALLAEHVPSPQGGVEAEPPTASAATSPGPPAARERRQNWGEAPDIVQFQGRTLELQTLQRWVLADDCRVVALLGIGGIGKTMLAARLAADLVPEFDRVYWRSLRNALPTREWLAGVIAFVSAPNTILPEAEAAQIELLLDLLRERRCLLVLDNMETVVQPGERDGRYREGYAGYGTVLQRLGESQHKSCLLLTSREAPPALGPLEGEQASVRSFDLAGLTVGDGRAMLQHRGLVGDAAAWAALVERYGGNSLALKISGESIRHLFGGDIAAFLREKEPVFGGVRLLLDEQIARLSEIEHAALRWLAVECEPVTFADLATDLGSARDAVSVLEAVQSLRRRSLLVQGRGFALALSLQSVVQEYVTQRMIDDVASEIMTSQPAQLLGQALIKATSKDYVRRSQERLIAAPVLERLIARYDDKRGAEQCLTRLLDSLRGRPRVEQGYGPGNLINLLRLLRGDLRGVDLSGLTIRQAYLQEVEAQDASFAGAHLSDSTIAEAFDSPSSVALSADGAYLAAGTANGEVRVWRLSDRTPILSMMGHTSIAAGVALSRDGRLVASGGLDGVVNLWEAPGGQLLATLRGHTGGIWAVALSGDGQVAASGGQDRTIRVWKTASGESLATLEGHTGTVWGVALSSDGRLVASGSQDGTVKLWSFDRTGQRLRMSGDTARLLATLEGHTGTVWAVALSGDGRLVASGSQDATVRLWNTRGEPLACLRGHTAGVWGVALSGDGRLVASSSQDGTVRLWETASGRPLATLQEHTGPVRGVGLSGDGGLVVGGGQLGVVMLWEAHEGRLLGTLQGHEGGLGGVALSGDGRRLVVGGGQDGTLRLWDPNDGRLVATLPGHTAGVWTVALSNDAGLLASGNQDGTVRLWDGNDGRPGAILRGHTGTVGGVALSGDGRVVVSGGHDGTVKLWEANDGRLRANLRGHTGGVWGVGLSADARVVASGSQDGTVRLWDSASGDLVTTLLGHIGGVWSVALSGDGRLVVGGGQDGTIRLWETASGTLLGTLEGHAGPVWSLAFTWDGRLVVSGSQDRTVKLWDAASGHLLTTLVGHTRGVWGVALSRDGQYVASQ